MRRLKVAYYTLKQHAEDGKLKNIGDRVIFLGVRNIMRCALGPHDEEICFLEDDIGIQPDIDIAVICGMPQILNARATHILRRIAEIGQSDIPVKLNLGAGSFYFDAFGVDRQGADSAFADRVASNGEASFYRDYVGFHAVTCRDHAGVLVLEKFGVPAKALPCPGFFSAMFEPRPLLRSGRELVSPLNGTASFWNAVRADVHKFYKSLWEGDNTRIFISHDHQDSTMLADLGIPFVEFNDAEDFIRFLAGFDRILSLRVHGALPSWTLGLDVTLLGLDRRALLGEDFGAKMRIVPLRSEQDMSLAQVDGGAAIERQDEDYRRAWLLEHLSVYVRLIRGVVADKLSYDFSYLGNDPLGGRHQRQITALRGKMPTGRYFSDFFFSRESEFQIPLLRMRSSQQHEKSDDRFLVTSNGHSRTLAFGPYIRIPAGLWRIEAGVRVSDFVDEQQSLTLSISKGIPGQRLGSQTQKMMTRNSIGELVYNFLFENPSDTGSIECIFNSSVALARDSIFIISNLKLHRHY
jgi:hypothetical protein